MHHTNISRPVGADRNPTPLEPPRTAPQALPLPTHPTGIPSLPDTNGENPSAAEGKEAVMLGVATGLAVLGVLMIIILIWLALRISRTARAAERREGVVLGHHHQQLFSPSHSVVLKEGAGAGGLMGEDGGGGRGGGGGGIFGYLGRDGHTGSIRLPRDGPTQQHFASRGAHRMEIESDDEVDNVPDGSGAALMNSPISPTYSMSSSFGPSTIACPTLDSSSNGPPLKEEVSWDGNTHALWLGAPEGGGLGGGSAQVPYNLQYSNPSHWQCPPNMLDRPASSLGFGRIAAAGDGWNGAVLSPSSWTPTIGNGRPLSWNGHGLVEGQLWHPLALPRISTTAVEANHKDDGEQANSRDGAEEERAFSKKDSETLKSCD
ncbi:hypothetical protein CF327_g4523 [Tilletia walkeri]|nr:hypothetical protein CF327_g4523 [Tilletia walkeri]